MKTRLRINFTTLLCFSSILLVDISCSSSDDPEPIDCTTLEAEVPATSKITPSGCASADGSITVQASGGKEPYQYSIDGGNVFQQQALFSNLSAGSYTVVVKDANQCSFTVQNVLLPSATTTLQISETTSSDGGCKTSTGSISIMATGGQAPYQYAVNGSTFGTSSTINALESGTYTVTVKDALGCSTTKSGVKVLSGVSFNTQIKPILQTNCIKSGCHDGGSALPNWSSLSTVQANAANIKTRVLNGSMPKDGTLTQNQKDLIACWVDDGAMNN